MEGDKIAEVNGPYSTNTTKEINAQGQIYVILTKIKISLDKQNYTGKIAN